MKNRLAWSGLVMATLVAVSPFTSADALAPDLTPLRASNKIPLAATAFSLGDVRLLDGVFRDAMMRNRDYLLQLEADRLLHTFRLAAGLPTKAKPYGGWEDPKGELRGHSLGHYLTACALAYASTGDERLKQRVDYIVAALAQCQAALPAKGYHQGFLSAYPEEFFDRVYARKPVWAPFYTLHKIMAGLLDAHQYCANAEALDVLVKLADWVKVRADGAGEARQQAMLDAEFGGMNEVLANLHGVTGNPEHLRLARAFDHRKVFDPLARFEDRLDGLHANTQIPKFTGAARQFELTAEPYYRDIARFAWERVALHRSYVIGGHSDREHFFPTNAFARHLGTDTCETCNTYNMLKLTRHLFAWAPDATTMDFYERALFNHILASQDPKTGMFVYFAPLKPGHFKSYSTPEDSFWCCVGTGMENHAKYADTIYFRTPNTLYVNLFIASELTWKDKGLVVRQETEFPESGISRLSLKCRQPLKLALKIRRPGWAKTGWAVLVNGEQQADESQPGSYVTLNREWRDGDHIELRLPLELRVESLPGAPEWIVFLQGPIVMSGELGVVGMPKLYVRNQTDHARVASPEVPVLVADRASVLSRVKPARSPLTWRTEGLGRPRDVTLSPFYRLHHQRYSVYWLALSEAEWQQRDAVRAAAEQKRKAYEARLVDEFHPGEQQSETDHQLKGERTRSGDFGDRKWRDADEGGWFSFRMKVTPGQPLSLGCTYWGSDAGEREFDILVDGEKLATQTLDRNRPDEFFDVEHSIPTKFTEGKQHVTIRFQAHPGKLAGGLFGARMLRQTR
jgi:hypothetical protein